MTGPASTGTRRPASACARCASEPPSWVATSLSRAGTRARRSARRSPAASHRGRPCVPDTSKTEPAGATLDRVRILLVDDHPVYRDGLEVLLGSIPGFEVVAAAGDGADAVAAAREQRPDVIVMDIQMPVMDGIEATRRIVADDPAAGIVVLTMSEDDES